MANNQKIFDVDKIGYGDTFGIRRLKDGSCWKATCANMLASAGYNPRKMHPQKFIGKNFRGAEYDIYYILIKEYNPTNPFGSGWVEDGLIWYLDKYYEPGNPYTKVSHEEYGSKDKLKKIPLADENLLQKLKSELYRGNKVAISISWVSQPKEYTSYYKPVGYGGHALTVWDINDKSIVVTNSDRDPENDDIEFERYFFDSYHKPNPNKYNLGVGHYFDYTHFSHPFIKYCVVLKKKDDTSSCFCYCCSNNYCICYKNTLNYNTNPINSICDFLL